jgi:hypothetical protein
MPIQHRFSKLYKDRVTLIYNDLEYKELFVDSFEIKIDEGNSKKRFYIKTNADYLEDYNFGDIEYIVVDTATDEEIKVRKIAKVKLLLYTEFSEIQRNSYINLKFDIIDFEIQEFDLILPIVSLIRDLKINKIDE